MKQKKLLFFFFSVLLLFCAGCGRKENATEGKDRYSIYYLNREETKIAEFAYYTDTKEPMKVLGELLQVLGQTPQNVGYHETISNFMITAFSINDNVVQISVDDHYSDLSPTTEVLTRAAIVRTLSQIDGITYVSMKQGNHDLTDHTGAVINAMTADQFVDNAGNEINTYENVNLTLYFASENGKYLIKAIRSVEYNSNISVEKLIVEKLIGGPIGEGLYPTINSNTKIESVTVKDKICYVNLSEDFLNQQYNVLPEVTIYSLVNSLVELESVNKVQIAINGDTGKVFREIIELSSPFERNLDILKSTYGGEYKEL
ncbi:MAG: GerMN domain-containing protein [Lachnospiraceae bacterium]|nr:GerMN domain-containing protein [Lachnospiraceae bacterium]